MNSLLPSINILNITNINIKHNFETKDIRIEICLPYIISIPIFVFSLLFSQLLETLSYQVCLFQTLQLQRHYDVNAFWSHSFKIILNIKN